MKWHLVSRNFSVRNIQIQVMKIVYESLGFRDRPLSDPSSRSLERESKDHESYQMLAILRGLATCYSCEPQIYILCG